MGRYATYPTVYNDTNHIDISFLKEHEYLNDKTITNGAISWKRHGVIYSSITICTNLKDSVPYLQLSYKSSGKSFNYKIELVKRASNLGFGEYWLFRCPHTKKLCRRLYEIGDTFLHRKAYRGIFYDSQLVAKKNRGLFSYITLLHNQLDLEQIMYSKHFKKTYNGKPTKKYLNILRQLNKLGNCEVSDYDKLLAMI